MKNPLCNELLLFQPTSTEVEDFNSWYVVNCVLNAFLTVSAIILNGVTIQAIRRTSSLSKPLKTLLLSLAVSDLGVGLLCHPFNIAFLIKWLQRNTENYPTCGAYTAFTFITNLLSKASFFGIAALSVDRFLAIHLHLRYQELVTHKRVVAVVISMWVLSALFALFRLFVSTDITYIVFAINGDGKFPICYAAMHGHLTVVRYLLQQELSTERLLADRKFLFDLMVCSNLDENESVIDFILQCPAPIYAAAKLSKHYRNESTREKERGRDLLAAGNVCENIASELLSLACADSAEKLLTAIDDRDVPFLDYLIECEQKTCVSHPSVQVYLGDVWRGDFQWDDWKYFLLFILCLICPPLWAFLCLPWNDSYHKIPIIKFICHLISHFYLIVLFSFTVVVPWEDLTGTTLLPRWYEWLLLIWLSGLLLSQLTDPHDRAGLGWIPIIVLFLSLIGILLHLAAFGVQGNYRINVIYSRNQFFATSMMLCFAQLLDFLSFHHLFGPWGVIIRDLMYDLVRFLVILSIFMVGFTAHLAAVYRPMLQIEGGTGLQNTTVDFFRCFELLFFSLFGLTEVEKLRPDTDDSATFILAKATFGIYNVITIIVLINLLIAMMSDTYQRIQMQSDIEWKFGRAKLIRNMKRSTTTPSPLNLVTKLFSYLRLLYKTKFKCCRADIIDILRTDEQLPDSTSMNPLYDTSNTWLPNGGLRHRESTQRNARIEEVIDWKTLVKKFLTRRGNSSEVATHGQANRDKLVSPRDSHVNMRGRTESALGPGRPGTSMGSTMSLHRVVAATVRKIDIVSNIKDMNDV
ncbi:hypothetical protein ACROYT_G008886 [Oculina patagonica]